MCVCVVNVLQYNQICNNNVPSMFNYRVFGTGYPLYKEIWLYDGVGGWGSAILMYLSYGTWIPYVLNAYGPTHPSGSKLKGSAT